MKTYVSLWSADLLDLRGAVRSVEGLCSGFHLDVFDGHNVPDLLFGPDVVAALRRDTSAAIDVHLNVTDPMHWVDRFADAGADMITVQSGPCTDVGAVLRHIRDRGCRAGLGLEVHESPVLAATHFETVDRLLIMGTAIGVKGLSPDPHTPERVRRAVSLRAEWGGAGVDIDVDGGIRQHTVGPLATAGADGVVPGSLVFGSADPPAVLRMLADLQPGAPQDSPDPAAPQQAAS